MFFFALQKNSTAYFTYFKGGDSAHREAVNLSTCPVRRGRNNNFILKQTEAKLWLGHIELGGVFSLGFLPSPFLGYPSSWTWETLVNYWSWLESPPLWNVNYEHISIYYATCVCVLVESLKVDRPIATLWEKHFCLLLGCLFRSVSESWKASLFSISSLVHGFSHCNSLSNVQGFY